MLAASEYFVSISVSLLQVIISSLLAPTQFQQLVLKHCIIIMVAAASETTALLIFLHNLVFPGYTVIYLLYSNKGWKAEITEKARSHFISIFFNLIPYST